MTHETLTDAKIALTNSGVFEWFDFDEDGVTEIEVARWMYENDASPEQAADHFGVA